MAFMEPHIQLYNTEYTLKAINTEYTLSQYKFQLAKKS